MKKEILLGLFLAGSIMGMNAEDFKLNNKKVYNAESKNIDAMLSKGLLSLGQSQMSDAEFNATLYKYLGIEIPGSNPEQQQLGKKISKEKRLQKGDLVFYKNATDNSKIVSGIVYKVNDDDFDILLSNSENVVKLVNSKQEGIKGNFVQGCHLVTDNDLKKSSNIYGDLVKSSTKADAEVIKNEEKLKKAQENVTKAEDKIGSRAQKVTDAQEDLRDAENDAKSLKQEATGYEASQKEHINNAQKALNNNDSKTYAMNSQQGAKMMEKSTKASEKAAKASEDVVKKQAKLSSAQKNLNDAQTDLQKAKDKQVEANSNLEKSRKTAEDLKAQVNAD